MNGRRQGLGRATLAVVALMAGACGGSTTPSPSPASSGGAATADASASQVATPSAAPSITAPPSIDPDATPPADSVQVPGMHVWMVPLRPFVVSRSFPGFQDSASGSSVLVVELRESFTELATAMTDTGLALQGIAVTRREEVSLADGRPGVLIMGTQRQGDIDYEKTLLLTGDDTRTALITATVPSASPDVGTLGPTVVAMLYSTFFDGDADVDPQAVLPFTVEPAPPLVFNEAFGQAATYIEPGNDDPLDPILVVAVSGGGPELEDDGLAAFALQVLRQAALVSIDTVESTEPFTAGDLEGVELVARATHEQGAAVVIHHVLFPIEGGYALLQGRCRIADRDACLATFRATAATFRLQG